MIAILGTTCSGMTTCKEILQKLHGLTIIDCHGYTESDELLAFLTPRWNEKFCLINVENHWKSLHKRPFICFLFIDASIPKRFARFESKFGKETSKDTFFEHYAQPGSQNYYDIIQAANVKILNEFNTVEELKEHLQKLNVVNDEFIRPGWDTYFIRICTLASKRSNCMKRQVGCVIIHNNRIVSTGYNGTPSGLKNCRDSGCGRCNAGASAGVNLDTCFCLHAEENAILEAGKPRLTYPCKLYCTLFPCVSCAKKIVQMGISEVIYDQDYNTELRHVCMAMFDEAKIKIRKHAPLQ
eukprot:NODE_147_length_17537_cov_0.265627.p4 type:complete len:297 gc:universal NODE_147_length_17537_cov_0.265627:10356-9466(-)